MRLLLDQDVYEVTAQYLEDIGHVVTRVASLDLSRASDEVILETAERLGLVLLTRDRDFGNLVFVRGAGAGVIYLRMLPATIELVHDELATVLSRYSEEQLRAAFVVVTDRGHRIRTVRR